MAQTVDLQDYAYYQVWWKINRLILKQLEFNSLVQEIVNAIFEELNAQQLGYILVALIMPDYSINALRRVAVSHTLQAQEMVKSLTIPYFEKVTNSLTDETNLCVKAFKEGKKYATTSWNDLFCPVISKEEAEKVQSEIGVKTVLIYPMVSGAKVLGLINFNLSKEQSEVTGHEMMLLEGIADAATIALENSRMYSKLQELDRLKDEFLSLAAHELRTPMTVIKGYSYELLKSPGLDPKGKQYIERIYKSTERLVNLVNDMLDVSRIESGRIELKMEKVEVNKIMADVMTEMSGKAAEKNIQLTFTPLGQTSFSAMADSAKLIQVLTNLLGNAVKFTPDSGKVDITMQVKNGFIDVQIADSGVGMDAEDLTKLFGKFVRVKTGAGIPGTGLGLYLSKKLVNLMGGEIWAKSDGAGQGSTFGFTIKSI